MKKIVFFLFCILFFAPLAFGDEIDDNLPEYTPGPVKERTREMITAGIPSENALNMTRMMVQNRFRQEYTVRAQNAVMNANRNEIPVEPIMNKISEGIAKKVPDDIVVRAMEMTLARYSFAYEHAKSITTNRDRIRSVASAITDSMAAGMLAKDIDRVIERLNRRSKVMERNLATELAQETFLATRTMARMGVSSKAAADVVCEAHQHRYSVKEMEQVRNAFAEHATRANSGNVANQYSRAIGRGETAESLGRSEEAGRGSDAEGSGGGGSGGGGSGAGGEGGSTGGDGSGSGSREHLQVLRRHDRFLCRQGGKCALTASPVWHRCPVDSHRLWRDIAHHSGDSGRSQEAPEIPSGGTDRASNTDVAPPGHLRTDSQKPPFTGGLLMPARQLVSIHDASTLLLTPIFPFCPPSFMQRSRN